MMTTVYEKTKKLQKSTDDKLEENLQTLEEKFIADGIKEMSLNDKSEDMAEVSTSEDSDKVSFKHIICIIIYNNVLEASIKSYHMKLVGSILYTYRYYFIIESTLEATHSCLVSGIDSVIK